MGLRDTITDALGGAVRGAAGLLAESIQKGVGADEPTRRQGGTSAAMVEAGDVPSELPPQPADQPARGLLYDPFALIDQLGYRDRPSGITYGTLREMAKRVPTYTAILQTRLTQVGNFGQVQKDPRDPGFGVVLRDIEASPSAEDQRRIQELETFILQTGSVWRPGRDNFGTFLKKLVYDSMVLDQACFEIVRNRKGEPAEFYAIDGGTVRLADVPPGAEAEFDPNQVKFVQVYDEVIITEWGAHELSFGVRNPRTDIRVNGYGFSELEMLINIITATLWSLEYNRRQFSQGTMANGILNFKGQVPDSKVDAFRRQWKMMISGVNNAGRVPMTNTEELQWIDFGKTNRDMEYGQWLDFLIKVTCAVCQLDPSEINFQYGNTGQQSQMFGSPVESKLRNSKDRGLRPMLAEIANWINVQLIWPLDPTLEFQFKGLDAKSEDQSVDLSKKKSEFLMTVDELRAEEDLDPLPDGKGAIILNPTWLQSAMAQQQQQQGGGAPPPEPPPEQDTGLVDMERDRQSAQPESPDDQFDAMYPAKSDRPGTDLQKGGRKAKVRVYEIDLP